MTGLFVRLSIVVLSANRQTGGLIFPSTVCSIAPEDGTGSLPGDYTNMTSF
jgi:hypothetical protein